MDNAIDELPDPYHGKPGVDSSSNLSKVLSSRVLQHCYRHACAEQMLMSWAEDNGGNMPTKLLQPMFQKHPWLKTTVGVLKDFCARSTKLNYRGRAPPVNHAYIGNVASEGPIVAEFITPGQAMGLSEGVEHSLDKLPLVKILSE
eukprot:4505347-Karenia_brevis.AAC.1